MLRTLLFLALAGGLVAYTLWIYLRVELAVPSARLLAAIRSAVLLLVLILLFDPRLPAGLTGGADRWVLVDATSSMSATGDDGATLWDATLARAEELESEGWRIVRFGGGEVGMTPEGWSAPERTGSSLAPALSAAAEGGASEVTVLSDMRFDDAVGLEAVLQSLPLSVNFERQGGDLRNQGIARLTVGDVLRASDAPIAEVEVFGGTPGDSLEVRVFEEAVEVATARIAAPSTGARTVASIPLPASGSERRARFTARVGAPGDAFALDDEAVAYANIGFRAGGLVLVSASPDWEPRYLLPVLREVTGLPATGYLRAGADRYVRLGRAADRGSPADSASVRAAAEEATVLVVHGVTADTDPWLRALIEAPGRRLVLPIDRDGAALVGLTTGSPRDGEWYASPDVPTSPIAGALAGADFQGLPPLSRLLVPEGSTPPGPLLVQLRGAGAPESALHLDDRPDGRRVVTLASGFWRWAARDAGRDPYRRLWSGVVGWLLSDRSTAVAQTRPRASVVEQGSPVLWNVGADSVRIEVSGSAGIVVDSVVPGGAPANTGPLPPGLYGYTVTSGADTLSTGRFDVSAASDEMLPAPTEPSAPTQVASALGGERGTGRPLRTEPWPYLLILSLLCVEWVVRRRSGLR